MNTCVRNSPESGDGRLTGCPCDTTAADCTLRDAAPLTAALRAGLGAGADVSSIDLRAHSFSKVRSQMRTSFLRRCTLAPAPSRPRPSAHAPELGEHAPRVLGGRQLLFARLPGPHHVPRRRLLPARRRHPPLRRTPLSRRLVELTEPVAKGREQCYLTV